VALNALDVLVKLSTIKLCSVAGQIDHHDELVFLALLVNEVFLL
jgi:hypothetical protein